MNANCKQFSHFDNMTIENKSTIIITKVNSESFSTLENINCRLMRLKKEEQPFIGIDTDFLETKQNSVVNLDSIFNPLNSISYLGTEKNHEVDSNYSISLKPTLSTLQQFESFVNIQNNQSGTQQNILNEKFLIRKENIITISKDEETTESLSRTNSSHSSIKNDNLENEQISNIEENNSFLKKRKRKNHKLVKISKDLPNSPQEEDLKLEDKKVVKKCFAYLEKYPIEHFERDLNQFEKCPHVDFMKNNFPSMFTHENFYKNIKIIKEKRKPIKHKLIHHNKLNLFSNLDSFDYIDLNYSQGPKPIWKPFDLNIVEYLRSIEKIWPYENYSFIEEKVLEFLMCNDYNIEMVCIKIKETHQDFEHFFMENSLIVSPTQHKKRKNNYSFRHKIKN